MGADDIVALLQEDLEQEEHTQKEVEQASKSRPRQLAERTPA
jgi:ferritin-like metal-binding protein YciE